MEQKDLDPGKRAAEINQIHQISIDPVDKSELGKGFNFNPFYLERIARVCHEANRSVCLAFNDTTQLSWQDAPAWQRESAIAGVAFKLNNPDATPADQHQNWVNDKVAQGWVFGEVKDPVAQTHPCIVPYEELPEFQKKKDQVFQAVVEMLK